MPQLAERAEEQMELRAQAVVAAAAQEAAEHRQQAVRADPAVPALDRPAQLAVSPRAETAATMPVAVAEAVNTAAEEDKVTMMVVPAAAAVQVSVP